MTTSAAVQGLEASGAAACAETPSPGIAVVPAQSAASIGAVPTTSLQPAPRTPAARMGLGTQALATALVVRSCPPGHLRTALDALGAPRIS